MKEQLETLKVQALEKLQEQSTLQQLGDWKATYLGKKGELTAA